MSPSKSLRSARTPKQPAAINPDSPSAGNLLPGSKRKATKIVVSDNEQGISSSGEAPKKKRAAYRAVPGTPEFDNLSPVSIAAGVEPKKLSKKLSFGSIEGVSEEGNSALAPAIDVGGKISRRRVPSEKALYMAGEPSHKRNGKNSAVSAQSNVVSSDPEITESNKSDVKTLKDQVTERVDDEKKTRKKSAPDVIEVNSSDSSLPPAPTPGRQKRAPAGKASVEVKETDCFSSSDESIKPRVPLKSPALGSRKRAGPIFVESDDNSDNPSNSLSYPSPPPPSAKSKGKAPAKNRSAKPDPSEDGSSDGDHTPEWYAKSKGKAPMKNRTAKPDPSEDGLSDRDHAPNQGAKSKGKARMKNPSEDGLSEHERAERKAPSSNPFIDDEVKVKDTAPHYYDDVMREELQDKRLKPFYKDLPVLKYCELIPFSTSANSGEGSMLMFSPVYDALQQEEKIRIRHGINFAAHTCYLNPARISPKAATTQMNRIVIRGNQQNCVLVSLGAVATCNLIAPAMGGFNQAYSVKNIAVYLFSQEYERTVSFFGTVYTKEHLFGPVADGAITFSTKKEGSNFNSGGPSTPKPKKFFKSSSNTGASSSGRGNSRPISYAPCLRFEDHVPIYDGRGIDGPAFNFSNTDFDNIRLLPLYKNGTDDLNPFSPVAIGYTVNAFPYSSQAREVASGTLALSPNIMFVILLGDSVE